MMPEQADSFAAGKLNYEAFVREEFRKTIAAGKSVTPLFDANNSSSPFNAGVARSYLFPDSARKVIGDTADAARKGEALPPTNEKGWKLMTDKAGNQAYVSPDKKQFEEPKAAPASAQKVAAVATKANMPASYAEWSAQQESLKGAVEAKGWVWEPDRWSYSIGANGEIQRELSPGRAWLKANYEGVIQRMEFER